MVESVANPNPFSYHHGNHDNPSPTEETLDILGVSVYKWIAPNGKELYMPVGHSSEGTDQNSPSEAWGYAMRSAIYAGNEVFFKQLVSSYFYFCNQSAIQRGNFGLMGWNPNIIQGDYSTEDGKRFVTSASDADEDIITALIAGFQTFGDFTVNDDVTHPIPSEGFSSLSIKELALKACQSFIQHDIGAFDLNGKKYDPILTNDDWGHDPLFPDYFDPMAFQTMLSFLKDNGGSTADIDRLHTAAIGTMQYIVDLASANNGWIPNNPYDAKFGYEAVRILMRFAQFIATPGADTFFDASFYNQARDVLATLVSKLVPEVLSQGGKYLDLSGACLTGPLLLALKALDKIGDLPSSLSQDSINAINAYFQADMKNYDINNGTSGWQHNGYYNIQLGILAEDIMEQLGL